MLIFTISGRRSGQLLPVRVQALVCRVITLAKIFIEALVWVFVVPVTRIDARIRVQLFQIVSGQIALLTAFAANPDAVFGKPSGKGSEKDTAGGSVREADK